MTARTKFPNSPQSDEQELVLHVVTLDDGRTTEVWAKDPMDAIQRVTAVQTRLACLKGPNADRPQ